MRLVAIDHVNLPVADLAQARAFYCDVLGLTAATRPDFDVPGMWVQLGSQQIHLVEGAGDSSPNYHFAVRVEDIEAVRTGLQRAGVTVQTTPHVPGAGRQLLAEDPFGNVIEFNQPD